MRDTERDLKQNRPITVSGRARQRKLKRQNGSGMPSQPSSKGKSQSVRQKRTTSRARQSIREQSVTNQIKRSAEGFSSPQGKQSTYSRPVSKGATKKSAWRNLSAFIEDATHQGSRHNKESRRVETVYKATQHTDTKRKAKSEPQILPKKNRRIYDSRSDAPPPVMVRGGVKGMAFGRVASSRVPKRRVPKRRIDVPLRVPGAEVRLPSLPFLQLGWRYVSLLMVLMMCASLFLIWKAPVFQVSTIQTVGLHRLTASDLNVVMGTVGKSIFTLNPKSLTESIQQAFPELSKISVRINLPASVKVVVTEREPVIAWVQNGVDTWIDAQGISFPPRGEPSTPLVSVEGYGTPPSAEEVSSTGDVSVMTAGIPTPGMPNQPSLRLSPDLVSSILALGAKMPAETTLVYDSEHGLGWNDPNGWEVFFGDEDQDMEMKLIVYQALVERLKSEGIQPALISVEYVHAPYYRMQR